MSTLLKLNLIDVVASNLEPVAPLLIRFDEALFRWWHYEDNSPILELFKSIEDSSELHVVSSPQKGCDGGALEVNCQYVNFEDKESGDAILEILTTLSHENQLDVRIDFQPHRATVTICGIEITSHLLIFCMLAWASIASSCEFRELQKVTES